MKWTLACGPFTVASAKQLDPMRPHGTALFQDGGAGTRWIQVRRLREISTTPTEVWPIGGAAAIKIDSLLLPVTSHGECRVLGEYFE
jgi:hypothetical protein